MRKLIALILSLFLTACGDFGYVRVHLFTPERSGNVTDSDYWPIVEEAFAILGYTPILVDYHRGAVTLEIDDGHGHTYDGRTLLDERTRCYRVARGVPSPHLLAHELGHQFGLRHVPDDDGRNLMQPALGPWDIELTEEQHRTIDRHVRRLGRC